MLKSHSTGGGEDAPRSDEQRSPHAAEAVPPRDDALPRTLPRVQPSSPAGGARGPAGAFGRYLPRIQGHILSAY